MEAKAPPEPRSPAAEKGTEAHELLEKMLLARGDAEAQAALFNSVELEMAVNVQGVLDYVDRLLDSDPEAILYSEVRFELPSSVLPGEAFGTCDIAVVLPTLREMHVVDYKNGVELVDHENNLQLRGYGCGVWFTLPEIATFVDRVAITIIQPNAFAANGPIRTWWTTPQNMVDFLFEYDEAAARTLEDNPVFAPGRKTCRWCKAITICPAAKAKALDAAVRGAQDIKIVSVNTLPDPASMPLDELAYTLKAGEYLRMWLDKVDQAAYALAMKGHAIPGKKLVPKISRRRYDGDPAQIAEGLVATFPVEIEDVFPRKLVTLTELESRISKAVSEKAKRGKKKQAVEEALEMLAFFTVKEPSTELTLVDMDDRRPAVNPVVKATEGISLPAVTVLKTQ
jgi:hypothetical protein